ncbi:MCA1 (YOR197W) [Zygosaccharomyces parabailii]|nr:MCA1 (YOR197W) [Zygosaccharomyces parabailii]CDH10606.1 related to Metacaspase-1 [Zygosaccharomyces bailii ISA1307]
MYSNNSQGRYTRPAAPPPAAGGRYHRPPVPPPGYGGEYHRPACPPPGAGGASYSRPAVPPPSGGYRSGDGLVEGPQRYDRPPANLPPPPSQMQSIQGTSSGYQYSMCNGKRKALIIGINYIGTQNQLRGCINDAHSIFNFLTSRYGYHQDDVVILTDDQTDMVRVPTRNNMLRAMQWLVKGAQPNDSLFLHYSGHGGQTKDLDGDEVDGMDDVIYPVDFEVAGHIVDDDLHDILVKPLLPGVRLTALFDSCHSGTALDLPYTYSTKGVIKEPNIWKDVGQDGLQVVMDYATGNTGAMFGSLGNIASSVRNRMGGSRSREEIIQMKFSPADVVMISGSKDNQTSADANEGGQAAGAMSYSFIKVLSLQPQQTYLSLLNNMRAELAGKYTQRPQLSSSHPIDVNLQFIM